MQTTSPEEAARLMRMATYASTAVALVLILTKTVAWMMTDSVSLLATLIDSCLDAAASILNLVAVRHALEPADKLHRFGHGKAESLAGLGQSTFIAGSAVFLCFEAMGRFAHPQPVEAIGVGIGVMIFSILATIGLLFFQQHVIRKSGSTAIKADHLHYKTDLIVNGSVIVALLLASYGWPGFDPVFAVAIAIYILFSAWEIAHEALDLLMDRELPDEDRTRIKVLVCNHARARGMHDLRTRKSGVTTFIQFHLELEGSLTLLEAHAISDEVELLVLGEFPGAEVIIHEDPEGLKEKQQEFTA
ncbi:MAG: cation diffusion facilitator family transporter [Mariprofundus sp.]|nr:cation diffusion facilitator family transporter [Mariprofundus sp.]